LRGGAVCLPDAFIPWNLSGHGVDISAWPAFFLNRVRTSKNFRRCRRPAPKGSGFIADWHLAKSGLATSMH
jgi:hypothetical protein